MPTALLPILVMHIVAGLAALTAGVVAMITRKRAAGLHSRAGTWFIWTMTAMALSAGVLTLINPDRLSLGAAVWTLYLVWTSRGAARSRDTGEWPLIALGALAMGLFADGAWRAAAASTGEFEGSAPTAYLVFGSLTLWSLVLDLSLRWRPRLSARARIARHLWRMTMAFFLAATSLFLGQQDDVFPFMAGSPILLLPSLGTLLFMVFWLARVRFAKTWLEAGWPRPNSSQGSGGAK